MNVVSDAFTDTSGTDLNAHSPEAGGAWSRHANFSGVAQLISDSNRLRANGFTDSRYYNAADPSDDEYDVVVTLVPKTSAGNAGVFGRGSTGVSTWYRGRFLKSTGWRLEKEVGGTLTVLGTDSVTDGGDLSTSSVYTLKLEIRNGSKTLYRSKDGGAFVQLVTSGDNAITGAGKAGTMANTGSNTTGYHMDTFRVDDLGPFPPWPLPVVAVTR